MSSMPAAIHRWPWSRRILFAGGVLLLLVCGFSCFRLTSMTVIEFCGDVKLANDVQGDYGGMDPATRPTVRPSIFPVGAECSYYGGPSAPRVTSFSDFGTVPILVGLASFPVAAILRIREQSSRSNEEAQ